SFQLSSFIFFFLTAALVTAPLIIYLTIINPSAEQRIDALSGPLNKLTAGNPSEVIQSTLNTLGMFTLRGDAVPIYNVSDRPVFPEPISAALFYLGLLVCLWRWKKPQYALMSIWFIISLGPAMITPFSPNFVRTIASWPIPFVFVGIGLDEALQIAGRERRLARLRTLSLSRILAIFFAVVLIYNSFSTARDYFINWPTGDYVRFWQQATWTQAVRTLNADPSTETVAASGLSINTFDPQTFDLLGLRSDIKVKWFDCRNAILFPAGRTIRYLIPAFFPCDQDLWSLFVWDAKLLNQPNWPGTQETIFALYDFERPQSLAEGLASSAVFPPVYIGSERFEVDKPLQPIATWVDFGGLRFCGPWIDQFTGNVAPKPGATVLIDTCWVLMQPVAPPLKIFVHITAPDGKIFAQWDGLDVNVGTLEPGDMFIQRHSLKLPSDLPSGPYRISLGVYNPDTDARLKAIINGQTIDSIVLGQLDVTP
ncbi:MAG TPA: hypothetical protein VFK30_04905, partial [Anaerolineae bacterium]|nr:hypothetical protein [Anaerolineae bacterium]